MCRSNDLLAIHTQNKEAAEAKAGVAALAKRLCKQPQADTLMLDMARMRLKGPDGSTELTASDALILSALIRTPGQSLERWQIGEVIGAGTTASSSAATLEICITRVRKKLSVMGAPHPGIKALHKVGYTLCCPVLMI